MAALAPFQAASGVGQAVSCPATLTRSLEPSFRPSSAFFGKHFALSAPDALRRREGTAIRAQEYSVEISHAGKTHVLSVPEDESILTVALDNGIDLSHDCRLGVCMTCPARLVSGEVDQTEGMLSEDVQEAGFVLMCVAYPKSDCKVSTISEDELLNVQLQTSAGNPLALQ